MKFFRKEQTVLEVIMNALERENMQTQYCGLNYRICIFITIGLQQKSINLITPIEISIMKYKEKAL